MMLKKSILSFLSLFTVLCFIFLITLQCKVLAKDYEPNWESLETHEVPGWYNDAKFGIFIHWGVYSVPAYQTEWYGHHMHNKKSEVYKYHKKNYGDSFEYKDFLPDFTAEKWQPKKWAQLFKDAGARYVVLTAEHHDGFPLWDCKYTAYDAVDKGPKRDLVGDLAEAVRNKDMKFAGSFHGLRNYYMWPDWPKEISEDIPGHIPRHKHGEKGGTVYLKYMQKKLLELMRKYKPSLLWLDGDWVGKAEQYKTKEIVAEYYNSAKKWDKKVAVNDRLGHVRNKHGDIYTPERSKMDSINTHKWETCTSIDPHSWGYSKATELSEYKTSNQIIDMLVDIVSKNGNLLLNIGPKANGIIPEIMKERLRDVGEWLNTNGEAIYGTTYWKTFGEGDIRFTKKGENTLYAIALTWPKESLTIEALSESKASQINSVSLLGTDQKVDWSVDSSGLTIKSPAEKPCNYAFVFKINHNK